MMGGDLTATSEVGVGSTFTIELPAEVDALEAAKATAATSAGEQEPAEEQGPTPGAENPILIIDDDLVARELLQKTLETDGHTVVTAASGEEGLGLAYGLQPSLITLDIMMPGMDGWAVLRELKAEPELEHIPVIMVSIVGDKQMGYTLGAVESLTKPVNRRQLLHLVQKHVSPSDGGHILIVDDDEPTRSLFRRTLEEEWDVSEAENGAVALERIAERIPDLILLDLMMPVMDGFDFTLELRRLDYGRAIPVIVITSKDLTEEDRLMLTGGVKHILEAGAFNQDELLEQIREIVMKQIASLEPPVSA
jgi:CheY-like chemotaxis protein